MLALITKYRFQVEVHYYKVEDFKSGKGSLTVWNKKFPRTYYFFYKFIQMNRKSKIGYIAQDS